MNQPYLLITLILSGNQCQKFARIAREKDLRGGIVVLGKGTVKNATLNRLGIKSQRREVVSFMLEKEKAKELLELFAKELRLDIPGHGIAYATPVITAGQIMNNQQRSWKEMYGVEAESMYEKLTVIVNRGMAEDAMDIARKAGARGGTLIHGRGTGSEFTPRLFGMEIEPEKELVMILMPSELIDKAVSALYEELQLAVPGNGILYVEPIVEVRGLFDSTLSGKST